MPKGCHSGPGSLAAPGIGDGGVRGDVSNKCASGRVLRERDIAHQEERPEVRIVGLVTQDPVAPLAAQFAGQPRLETGQVVRAIVLEDDRGSHALGQLGTQHAIRLGHLLEYVEDGPGPSAVGGTYDPEEILDRQVPPRDEMENPPGITRQAEPCQRVGELVVLGGHPRGRHDQGDTEEQCRKA
ncbi:MAG: hypothetical protein OXG58_03830 [Gemmatimonadetes bacterium]|nr:hypothetical protein [Gemmatimonadota bacterium]MCY3942704.1 hypothetical protein [Gemmatimonadota bacterium]